MNNTTPIWPLKGKEFVCPSCKSVNELLLHNLAKSFICKTCNHYILTHSNDNSKLKPDMRELPFQWKKGTLAELNGITWIVTGGFERKEQGAPYYWQEYCLYHPLHGFAWLQEYSGNWILLRETEDYPFTEVNNTTLANESGETFHLFLRYKTELVRAFGEFPYDIKDKQNKLVKEFIAPPVMYMRKDYSGMVMWLKGIHLNRTEVYNALGMPDEPIPKTGIGSIQPQKWGMNFRNMGIYACLTALLLVLFQWAYTSFMPAGTEVFGGKYTFSKADSNSIKGRITESFSLGGNTNNVEFYFSHDLLQDWMELECNLVNEESGEEFTLTREMGFYSGYDDEGAWTDGAMGYDDIISEVPPGRYHLLLTPYLSGNNKPVNVSLKLNRAVAVNSNLYWYLGLLALLVYIQYLRVMTFERKRWSNSNYSTYDHRSWWERNLGGDDE